MKFLQLKCTTVFAEDTNVFVQEQISSKLVNLKLSKVLDSGQPLKVRSWT